MPTIGALYRDITWNCKSGVTVMFLLSAMHSSIPYSSFLVSMVS
jgi:hypothetical protein